MADWAAVLLMHGASGAVTGCMGGTVRLMMSGGADPAGRRFALVFVAVLFVLNLLFGVFGPTLLDLDARIAWQAHIGGFIAGFLIGRAPNPGAALGILQDGGRDR